MIFIADGILREFQAFAGGSERMGNGVVGISGYAVF